MTHLVEHSKDGTLMKKIDLRGPNKRWQHPWLLVHRVNLHEQLKKLATGEGEGTPAKLHTASKVVEIDPEKGTLTLENGETSTADVIIGADGVYVCLAMINLLGLVLMTDPVCDQEVHQRRQTVQLRKGCLSVPYSTLSC